MRNEPTLRFHEEASSVQEGRERIAVSSVVQTASVQLEPESASYQADPRST